MKKLILLSFFLMTNVMGSVQLSYCFNTGSDVSYFFSSCVNNNFQKVARELKTVSSSCFYSKYTPLSSYTACVNSNFTNLQLQTSGHTYMFNCSSYGDTLSATFTFCVNNNFTKLQNYINGLEQ